MLSIAAMGGHSLAYFLDLAREDYYLAGGEPPGQWQGRGASELKLEGATVDREEFRRLFRGFGPDNVALVKNAGRETRHPGWDLTFSAPKGISVVWSVAPPEARKAIERLHEHAVARALSYLEDAASLTRRGRGGTEVEAAAGLVVATFQHGTSRAQDANLHTHALVLNVARREDGTFGTLAGRPLFQHKMVAGALYRAELARGVEALGLVVSRRPSDVFDVVGPPEALIEEHSKRRQQVKESLRSRGESGARAAARATLSTREKKAHVPRATLFDRWREVAERFGFDSKAVGALLATKPPERDRDNIAGKREALAGALSGITARKSTFTERDFLRRLAAEAPGRGLGIDDVRNISRDVLANSPDIVRLGRIDGEQHYTTRELWETEHRALSAVEKAKSTTYAMPLSAKAVDSAVRTHAREKGYALSAEQLAALRHITQTSGSMHVVEGMAGTGKTDLLLAAKRAWESEGHHVIGAAIAGKAARGLQDATGIESYTIARLLKNIDGLSSARGARGGASFRFDAGTILVVDEAGMVGTRQAARLIDEAQRAKVRIVWVGDSRQLPAIDAGAPFRAMGDILGRAELSDIRRQKEAWAVGAVKKFAAGDAALALAEYAKRGLLHVAETRSEAIEKLLGDWKARGINRPEHNLILAGTRAEVDKLNAAAQAERRQAGELGRRHVAVDGQRFYEGDRVLFTRNNRALAVSNGDLGTVEALSDGPFGALRVRLDGGKTVNIPLEEYRHVQLGYAVTTHKAQGATATHTYILAGGPMQDRALSYVQASRARGETRFYTDRDGAGDRVAALAREMERVRSNELARETLARADEMGHDR